MGNPGLSGDGRGQTGQVCSPGGIKGEMSPGFAGMSAGEDPHKDLRRVMGCG